MSLTAVRRISTSLKKFKKIVRLGVYTHVYRVRLAAGRVFAQELQAARPSISRRLAGADFPKEAAAKRCAHAPANTGVDEPCLREFPHSRSVVRRRLIRASSLCPRSFLPYRDAQAFGVTAYALTVPCPSLSSLFGRRLLNV